MDEQDRLLRAGSVRYAYDDAGQLERRIEGGAVTEYEYDALGHLRRVQLPSGEVISYLVDARGRRVARLVDGAFDRLWAYQDGLNPIAEFDGTGKLTKRFIYGTLPHVPDLIVLEPAGTVLRVVTDQVGSVRRVVDVDTGQVMQSLDYSPFGVIENETRASDFDQPFRFAGGLHDRATGLIRFGARDYDPHLGRWTAKDPIGFAGGSSNLYEYAAQDPINYVDATGERKYPIYRVYLRGKKIIRASMLSLEEAISHLRNYDSPSHYRGEVGERARHGVWVPTAKDARHLSGQFTARNGGQGGLCERIDGPETHGLRGGGRGYRHIHALAGEGGQEYRRSGHIFYGEIFSVPLFPSDFVDFLFDGDGDGSADGEGVVEWLNPGVIEIGDITSQVPYA